MKRSTFLLFAAPLAGALVTLLAAPAAHAQRRSPLEGQPAVRHKLELRKARFELAPTFQTSVAADYMNTVSAGLKAEYHLTDMLSFGGAVFFGASFDTGLSDQITGSLPTTDPAVGDPTPTREEFQDHLNKMPLHGAAAVTLTPWFGKMSLFQKAFINFDVYFKGGFGFASLTNDWSGPDTKVADATDPMTMEPIYRDPLNDGPQNSGFRPGVMIGGGVHAYVNDWLAIDLSFDDYVFNDNPSGLDFDADGDVDSGDQRFMSHLFFGVGVSMFLPAKARISE